MALIFGSNHQPPNNNRQESKPDASNSFTIRNPIGKDTGPKPKGVLDFKQAHEGRKSSGAAPLSAPVIRNAHGVCDV